MNTNNIIKLIKAYFYENWQKDILYSFAIVATTAMFSLGFGLVSSRFVVCLAAVLTALQPVKLFGNLYQSSSRMHYLTLPANTNEKVVTNMLLVNVYFVILMVFALCIGFLLGYGIGYVRNPEMLKYNWGILRDMISNTRIEYLLFFSFIAVMFFASIYFKKNPFWKLVLTGVIVSIVLGVITAFTEWLNVVLTVPAEIRNGNYFKINTYVTKTSDWFPYVACGVSIVYFYAMSFLRMKETEA